MQPPSNGHEQQSNGHIDPPQLSELLRAVMIGLRDARTLIAVLINDSHPAIVEYDDTTVILIEAPKVADALESIALRLEAEAQEEGE